MKLRKPDYYDSFSCIAGACPDTCCRGWSIVVDAASAERFATLQGDIGARLRAALACQDGETVITCRPDGRCQMLEDDGLCSLQSACGEESLCQVCHRFPRFVTQIGLNQEWGLSLSCPEAARLILTRTNPVTYIHETNEDRTIVCHDVDPDFYFGLKQARDRMLELLQDRSLPLIDRVQTVNELANRLQKTTGRFARRSLTQVLEDPLPRGKAGCGSVKTRRWLLEQLLSRQPRRSDWHPRLKQALQTLACQDEAFAAYAKDFEILQEQLLVYEINKHLIRAAFDGDIAGAVRYSLASWVVVCTLARAQWLQDGEADWVTLAQQYAAETENDEEGCQALFAALRKLPRRKMQELLA